MIKALDKHKTCLIMCQVVTRFAPCILPRPCCCALTWNKQMLSDEAP